MIFYIALFVVLIFSNKILVAFTINFFLLILIYKKNLLNNYLKIMEKFFVFLITIFISYIFLAYIKKDFYIFLEYLKSAILLSLKIFGIVSINLIIINDNNLKKFIPKKFYFIMKLFNSAMKNLDEIVKNYSKKEILINIDKILAYFIIKTIKENLKYEI